MRKPIVIPRPLPRFVLLLAFVIFLSGCSLAAEQSTASDFSALDAILQDAVANKAAPGFVCLVGHDGHVVYRKAFGQRSLEPTREAMTVDTVFDMASLTKVIATTTSVMKLVQEGKVKLNDPVATYIPEFRSNGKGDISVRM